MERSVFVQHVQDAVGHLGDFASLRDHPLGVVLLAGIPTDERGAELSHILIAAIEELRPTESAETNDSSSRRYEYLSLRYVQRLRAAQVAHSLGLSERQTRRIHHEAIEALATRVWAKRRTRRSTAESTSLRLGSDLDAEVARLGATPSRTGAYLGDTLKGAIETVAPLAQQQAVRIDVTVTPSMAQIAVDRAVLRQVFVNMLVAAVERGTRSISIGAAQSGHVVAVVMTIRFRTNGDASTAESIRLGEPFRVVRRLIELQAGMLEVRTLDATTLAATVKLPVLRPTTVLLVDDNPDTLRLFRRYLASGPYRTIEATNGRQAKEMALQAHPDVVVLDVMMPSQDGWETLQALRHDLETEDIPVVVCSVLRQRDLALALGAVDFLEKPISREALLAVLDRQIAPAPASPRRS